MTRKVKISFFVLVWSIVAIQMYVNYEQKQSQTVTAFSVVEDNVSEENVKGYGYFGKMELSQSTKKKMLENLAYKLGITDGYWFVNGSGDGFEKTVLTKEGKHATTVLQLISMDAADEETEKQQYIVMEINTGEKPEKALNLYEKIKKVYKEIGVDGQVSMEVSATQKGNCVSNNHVIDEFLKLLEAKQVDTIMENGIYTVYGYTKSESDYLTLNGQKVNVQIVMTYNEEEDVTYIKIGMPIVNSSY